MAQTEAFASNHVLKIELQTGAVQPGEAGCHPARFQFHASFASGCSHSMLSHSVPCELQQITSPAHYTKKLGYKAVNFYRSSFLLAGRGITS